MSSIPTKQIDGDVAVGRNVSAGGDANIQGSARVGHDLRVEGWLEAKNIKAANKGLFATPAALRIAYPQPHDGWFAGVPATDDDITRLGLTPQKGLAYFRMLIGNGGDWVWEPVDKLYQIEVNNEQFNENLSTLQKQINDVEDGLYRHRGNHTEGMDVSKNDLVIGSDGVTYLALKDTTTDPTSDKASYSVFAGAPLKQSTGLSEKAVMSQKAVTDMNTRNTSFVIPASIGDYSQGVEELLLFHKPKEMAYVKAYDFKNASDIRIIVAVDTAYASIPLNSVTEGDVIPLTCSVGSKDISKGELMGFIVISDKRVFHNVTPNAADNVCEYAYRSGGQRKIVKFIYDKISSNASDIIAMEKEFSNVDEKFSSIERSFHPFLIESRQAPAKCVDEMYLIAEMKGAVLKRFNDLVYLIAKSDDGGIALSSIPASKIKSGEIVAFKVTQIRISGGGFYLGQLLGHVIFNDVSLIEPTTTESINVSEHSYCLANSPKILENIYLPSLLSPPRQLEKIGIFLPDTLVAVVGDTLQLFYKSMFGCVNPYGYNIEITCDIGSQYPRYYEVTPTSGNIGEHSFKASVKDNENNILGEKTVKLKVVASPATPSEGINILCVGASATQGGNWVGEFKRRLTGSANGSPNGLALANIKFVGRMSVTESGNQSNLEATGGYTFRSYLGTNVYLHKFFFTQGNLPNVNVGDIYEVNGKEYTVSEINIPSNEQGYAGYISCSGPSTVQGPMTLNKVSGSGDESLTCVASSSTGNPFAYDNAVNVKSYVDDYCDGKVDIVYTELFGNGTKAYDDSPSLADMISFINNIKTDFPNCKFAIGTFWAPDEKGGCGANYGAMGDWHNPRAIKYSAQRLIPQLQKYINDNRLEDSVFIVDWLNELDSENGFNYKQKPVNIRSTVSETFGTNGVHPSNVGYYQMADTAYRMFAYIQSLK